MALFRRKPVAQPEAAPVVRHEPGSKKSLPTPSRKEAEAARRQRVTQTYSKKEARAYAQKQGRTNRVKAINVREGTPERSLMRDHIDTRFNLGEFLLPSVVIILAVTIVGQRFPGAAAVATLAMYVFILLVIVDNFFMWRAFKKLLADRLPGSSPRGLLMYGMTRGTQIRRFRLPSPRLKRGEKF